MFIFTDAIFLTSRRGKPVIQIGEHRYNKYSRSKGAKAIWVCVKWSTKACRASITTIDDTIIKTNNYHTH
ncbi:unnamed protein product [Parnassius mnemosyne]|uniref:FLYWCH-type domain-containing protein n=1 Tax=Parnassius mnemosyne TaxID=213953 RepID=A0AAV1KBE6_9NEOP